MTWPWDPWRLSVMLSGKGKRCQIISRNANSCDEIWRNHVPTTQNGKSASKSNAVWTCVDWISWISRFKTSIAFGKPSILRFKQPKQNAFKLIPVTVPVDRWFWSQVLFLFLFVFLFTPGATANKRKQWNLRCLTILPAMDPNRVPGKWASQCCKSLVASKSVDCFWNVDPTCDLFMYLSETLGSPEGVPGCPVIMHWRCANQSQEIVPSTLEVIGNRNPISKWCKPHLKHVLLRLSEVAKLVMCKNWMN